MANVERKSFDAPDDRHPFPKGRGDTVEVGGHTLTRAVFEPGWRWSESIGPSAGTDRCQKPHFAYIVSGRAINTWEDGTEIEFGPGDVVMIPPGHEAWVVGDEPMVFLDLQALIEEARTRSEANWPQHSLNRMPAARAQVPAGEARLRGSDFPS